MQSQVVPYERDEGRLGQIARSAHLVRQPVFERLYSLLLGSWDVGVRLARNPVKAAIEFGALCPGHDLDSRRRFDTEFANRGKVEHHATVSLDLGEPPPLGEGDALRVILVDPALNRV